jgi:hypothetical protein
MKKKQWSKISCYCPFKHKNLKNVCGLLYHVNRSVDPQVYQADPSVTAASFPTQAGRYFVQPLERMGDEASLYMCYSLAKTLIATTTKLSTQIAVDERNLNMKK